MKRILGRLTHFDLENMAYKMKCKVKDPSMSAIDQVRKQKKKMPRGARWIMVRRM